LIDEEFFSKDNLFGKRIILKENLLEHHDYEAVSKNVFRYLKKWYGVDHEIVRFLKKDPLDDKKLYLDLYPEKNNGFKNNLSIGNLRLRKNKNHSYEEKFFISNQNITLNTLNDYPSTDFRLNHSNSSVRMKSYRNYFFRFFEIFYYYSSKL